MSLAIGSVNQLDMGVRSVLDFGGLFIIALASGGIKPCVSSFAADQVTCFVLFTLFNNSTKFSLTNQDRLIVHNFSVFSTLQSILALFVPCF